MNSSSNIEKLCSCGHSLEFHNLCGCESWLIFNDDYYPDGDKINNDQYILGTKVDGVIHHDCFGGENDICSCTQWNPLDKSESFLLEEIYEIEDILLRNYGSYNNLARVD